jgi:hypothetical protein
MEREDQTRGLAGFPEALAENEAVQFAGLALACGLNPLLVLDSHDPVETLALEEAVVEAARVHKQWRIELANRLGDVLAKAFSS